jgi:hypothetical protein
MVKVVVPGEFGIFDMIRHTGGVYVPIRTHSREGIIAKMAAGVSRNGLSVNATAIYEKLTLALVSS